MYTILAVTLTVRARCSLCVHNSSLLCCTYFFMLVSMDSSLSFLPNKTVSSVQLVTKTCNCSMIFIVSFVLSSLCCYLLLSETSQLHELEKCSLNLVCVREVSDLCACAGCCQWGACQNGANRWKCSLCLQC